MTKSHKKTQEFVVAALIGSIVGIAVIAATHSKGKKGRIFRDMITALQASSREHPLGDIIDWTSQGIELWNHFKKGK